MTVTDHAPVASAQRQVVPDVLRGVALLLILLVNIEFLSQSVYLGYEQPRFDGLADQMARWLVLAFCQLNAYLLFSLLFGLGLALQLDRVHDEALLRRRYNRRMAGLAAIGVVHAILLFVGDILVSYALLGLLLFRFRNAPERKLLRIARWTLVGAAVISVLLGTAIALDPASGRTAGSAEQAAAASEIFRTGSFLEVTEQRIEDLVLFYIITPLLQWPSAFAMFLVGLVLGRRGVLADPAEHREVLRRTARWGGLIGGLGGAVSATLIVVPALDGGWSDGLALALRTITAPALALAYVAAIALLFAAPHRTRLTRLLAREQSLGRLSLSIYVGESVIASLLFNGYGLGLYGRYGPAAGVLISFAIWLACIPLAQIWLRHFRFGPLEWLLRSWTYRSRQTLRSDHRVLRR